MIEKDSHPPHLIWVTSNDLTTALDGATFLDTADELRKLGWKVSLICGCQQNIHEVRGIEVTPISSPDTYFLGQHIFHQRALKWIKKQDPPADVVMFQQDSGLWMLKLLPWRWLRGQRRPLLMLDTRSVYMPEKATRQKIKGLLRETYLNTINWAANRWTDGQTAITQRIAQAVNIPPDKLWGCWPSGVDPVRFADCMAQRNWPSGQDPIRLIYIGSTHYERNLLSLSKAVVIANQQAMSFHFTIIGGGAQQEELRDFAAQYPKILAVHDAVPHEQIPGWLSKAHIGTLPFPDEEKFRVSSPIKLFEYMAAGMPVMATRIVCHTDVMHNADFALYADGSHVDDLLGALTTIWQNKSRLPQWGEHAQEAAQQWSWTNAARKLKHALETGLLKHSVANPSDLRRQRNDHA